jgi:hypothetical protein
MSAAGMDDARMDDAGMGHRRWAVSAGWAPSRATGAEPLFSSRDEIALLNTGPQLANVRLRVLYAEHGLVGPYRIGIAPRRLRHLRINDLIFPEAVRLDEAYGLVIDSDRPVVVQFTRQDTRAAANAGLLATAWGE